MNRFVQNENVVQLRKLIAIAEGDPSRDEVRYQLLSLLLADEEAKGVSKMPRHAGYYAVPGRW